MFAEFQQKMLYICLFEDVFEHVIDRQNGKGRGSMLCFNLSFGHRCLCVWVFLVFYLIFFVLGEVFVLFVFHTRKLEGISRRFMVGT